MKPQHTPVLDYFRRMSEQQHPEVLPASVDTLASAKDSVASRIDIVESYHEAQRTTSKRRFGIVALATTVSCLQVEAINLIAKTGIPMRPTVLFGAAVVGLAGALEVGKDRGRQQVSHQLQYEHSQIAEYHQVAFDRAVEAGIIEPTSE